MAGQVSEWSMVRSWKDRVGQPTESSNLSLSASHTPEFVQSEVVRMPIHIAWSSPRGMGGKHPRCATVSMTAVPLNPHLGCVQPKETLMAHCELLPLTPEAPIKPLLKPPSALHQPPLLLESLEWAQINTLLVRAKPHQLCCS